MDSLNDQLDIEAATLTDGQRLLVVRGEIEFRTAPMLKAAIDAALNGDARGLTIDLSAVTFIDSTCLAVLVDTNGQTSLLLRTPSPAVERVIALTGLSSTLAIQHA